jgi:SAM-dependent methyltransferase
VKPLNPSPIKNRLQYILSSIRWSRFRRVSVEDQLSKMRHDWDRRAQENARHYVATGQETWTDEEFFASGKLTVEEHILNDMVNICQGREPGTMKVLEIGCGAGRVTRALAGLFGEVHAVDISGEMVRLARQAVSPLSNAFVYRNNGTDLSVIPVDRFDFAFSNLVFQHIPSRYIIRNYIREVHRLLRPGALFKFQVRGNVVNPPNRADDTWVGAVFSDEEIVKIALQCGFEARYRHGAGEQDFWIWYFKQG